MATAQTIEGAISNQILASGVFQTFGVLAIHPASNTQQSPRPKVTIQRIISARTNSNDGPVGDCTATFQIVAWADALLTAIGMTNAIRAALTTPTGGFPTTFSGIHIDSVRVSDEDDMILPIIPGQTNPPQGRRLQVVINYAE